MVFRDISVPKCTEDLGKPAVGGRAIIYLCLGHKAGLSLCRSVSRLFRSTQLQQAPRTVGLPCAVQTRHPTWLIGNVFVEEDKSL